MTKATEKRTEEVARIMDQHVCHPWPRWDPETRTTLVTIRCRECGEVCASSEPIATLRASNKHAAQVLVKAGLL